MTLALIGFAVLLALSFMGFPLGFTTLVVGVVGFAYTRGWDWHAAFTMMSQQIVETGGSYGLSVIPLFILMGVFIHRSNISEDLYRASYALVGKYRGGLAQSTVLACAGFAAVSGSSLATAATMAKVAMPHMRAYRYDDALSSGVVSAGGTLGIMIPPSVPMVIYCLVAQEDVGKMFIAGVVPGILLTGLFMVAVYATILRNPASGPAGERMPAAERWQAYLRVWPVLALFVFILGGIYAGAFTPTEASGMGAIGAALFAFWRGRLRSLAELYASLIDACKTTATLFMVIFGAQVFANFINLSGLPGELVSIVESLQPLRHGRGAGGLRHLHHPRHDLRERRLAAADRAGVSADADSAGRRPHLVRHRNDRCRRNGADHAADRHERLRRQDCRAGHSSHPHLRWRHCRSS